MAKVLVCGVYLADKLNHAAEEIAELNRSKDHQVEQRWIALDVTDCGSNDLPHTVRRVNHPTPKFELLNGILADAPRAGRVLRKFAA